MRPLAPKGGNDRVMTPPDLAVKIVRHFKPFGSCLEPCSGADAFVKAMASQPEVGPVYWCEIDRGIDFLESKWTDRLDFCVSNPPWSKFRPFLIKSMEVADNVIFLSLLNAWFMRARVQDMRKAGFGLVEALMLDTPPKPWPQTGFQLAAVHAKRGWVGDMKITHV